MRVSADHIKRVQSRIADYGKNATTARNSTEDLLALYHKMQRGARYTVESCFIIHLETGRLYGVFCYAKFHQRKRNPLFRTVAGLKFVNSFAKVTRVLGKVECGNSETANVH